MAKGSKLARLLDYFRTANADEARVVFTLVKEIMEERLKDKVAKTPVKRRRRRTRAEMEAALKGAEYLKNKIAEVNAVYGVTEVPSGGPGPTAKASD